jgi:hypothetical protein
MKASKNYCANALGCWAMDEPGTNMTSQYLYMTFLQARQVIRRDRELVMGLGGY